MIQQVIGKNVHPYIDQIQRQLGELGTKHVDFLVVAHNDPVMIERLGRSFPDATLAVLAIPQSCWAMDDDTEHEVLQWAAEELKVKAIWLVGHSNGGTPADHVQVIFPRAEQESKLELVKRQSLFDRVQKCRTRVSCGESHFREQLEFVAQHSQLQSRLTRGDLELQGLFYRADSGTFCLFKEGELEALVA